MDAGISPNKQTQNGHFCFLIALLLLGEWGANSGGWGGGPDWTRTSDPALIKRML